MKLPVPGPIPEQGSASVQATLGLGGKVEYSVQTAEDASGLIGIVEKQTLVNAATVATSGAMPSNPQLAAQVNAEGQRLLGLTPEDNAFANKNITALQMGGIEFNQKDGSAMVINGQKLGVNVLGGMGTELSANGPIPGLPKLSLGSGVVLFSRASATLQTSTPIGKLTPEQALSDPWSALTRASVAQHDPLAAGRVQTLKLQAAGETSFLGVGGQGVMAKATVTLPSGKLFNADSMARALNGDFAGVMNNADAMMNGSTVKASLMHYNNTGSFGVLGAAFETSSGAAIKGEIEAHHGVRDMDDAPLWEYNGTIPQATSGIGGWLQAQLDKVPPEAWDALRYLP